MKPAKKALPILFALCFVLGLSYYLFSKYKPNEATQVKGAKVSKEKKSYLDSIPLPGGSQEIGRNERESFSQITVLSTKAAQDVQKYYRGLLASKGWTSKDDALDLLSIIYNRDREEIEISVLSTDDREGTVFSISHSY